MSPLLIISILWKLMDCSCTFHTHHFITLSILFAADPGEERQLVMKPKILLAELFFPHWSSSKLNKPLWLEVECFLHFELVRLPSIVLLRAGNRDSWVRYEPFICQNETTCIRFKHSFICIKACCSVHIVPFLPYPDMWASLLYHFKFYYPTMLVSKLHWVASSRTDVQMQQ